MERISGLGHLFMTVFLYNISIFMVIPAITDVTMSALCPGEDECSLAIYLTGIQQAIMGLGTLVMMPLIGNLSDTYGRKSMLTVPMCLGVIPLGLDSWASDQRIMGLGTLVMMPLIGNLSDTYGRKSMLTVPMCLGVIPLAILAFSRERSYFYAYYVLKTLTSMVCEGSVHCLALAYVADNVRENRRAPVFGILSGISSFAFVCGNLFTRFLSTPSTFQVSASVMVIATVYMRVLLPESMADEIRRNTKLEEDVSIRLLDEDGNSRTNQVRVFKTMPSFGDSVSLLRSSSTFSQAAIVTFSTTLGDSGLHSALQYFLKAKFHFNKDQFADLMVINGITGTISQMVLMPILVPAIGEEKLLSMGLFFSCAHILLYSIAWAPWVPYVSAMITLLAVFAHPCIRSIASKQVGPSEQGKAQGCISGLNSFAHVVSPWAFSPLTALFMSANAPFRFPGFSIACAGFAMLIAFVQSIMIRAVHPISVSKVSDYSCVAEP